VQRCHLLLLLLVQLKMHGDLLDHLLLLLLGHLLLLLLIHKGW
jgi:hypothetical protein